MSMFYRYTESARKTNFIAKHEADGFGALEISTEHILLALLRDTALIRGCMDGGSVEQIRDAINVNLPRRELNQLPHDLPLSNTAREALIMAEEEANRLGHEKIRNEHLLLGLIDFKGSYAVELLTQRISVNDLRRRIEPSLS